MVHPGGATTKHKGWGHPLPPPEPSKKRFFPGISYAAWFDSDGKRHDGHPAQAGAGGG